MEIYFMPYKAFWFVCAIAVFYFSGRYTAKVLGLPKDSEAGVVKAARRLHFFFGGLFGLGVFSMVASVLITYMPVRMGVDTQAYNKRQDAVIMQRHNEPLPPRVTVERLSYEEELAQKNEALRSRGETK